MKAINSFNQPLLNSILVKIEFYKNSPSDKLAWIAMAKDVQASVNKI